MWYKYIINSQSLIVCPYCSLLLAGSLNSIQYLQWADEYSSLLVSQHSCVELYSSVCPYFFNSVSGCLVCLTTWVVCEIGGSWQYSFCFLRCCFQDLFKTTCSILYSSYLAFTPSVLLKSSYCSHMIILTHLQLGRIPGLFYLGD